VIEWVGRMVVMSKVLIVVVVVRTLGVGRVSVDVTYCVLVVKA
jgi:hypothetical protein